MRFSLRHAIVLPVLLMPQSDLAASQSVRIATGTEEGVYHLVGQALVRLMSEYDIADAEAIVTAGTMENLDLLQSGGADLALVQSDILATEERATMRALGALFPEYTQILVRNEDPFYRPVHLVGQRLFLGKVGSGTRRNATDILRSLRIYPDYYDDVSDQFASDEAVAALLDGRLDALFWTGSDLLVNHPDVEAQLRMLTLSEDDRKRIRSDHAHWHFGFTTLTDRWGNQTTVMFTRAVLVARAQADDFPLNDSQIVRLLQSISYDLEVTAHQTYERPVSIFQGDQCVRGIPIPLHPVAEKYYQRHGMLPNMANLLVVSVTLWMTLVLIAYLRYANPPAPIAAVGEWADERFGKPWIAIKVIAASPMMLSLWVLFALLVTNVLIIMRFESIHSFQEQTSNPFAGRTVVELLAWLVTMAGTSVNLDLYPQSVQGRIAAALIPISGFVYAILLVTYSCIQKIRRDDLRARGLDSARLRDHVVICGWNRRVPRIICEITNTQAWRRSRKVLVLAEHDEEKPLARYRFRPRSAHYLRGISSDYAMLKKASLTDASCIIIVADDRKVQQENLRGIFTAMAVKHRLERDGSEDAVKVIAELFHETNANAFRMAGVDKIINVHRISVRFLVHACMNPGVSDLVSVMLSFSSPQSITMQAASGERLIKCQIVGRTYDDALIRLRQENLLLLAIYRQPDGGLQHEPSELDFRTVGSPYLINPTDEDGRSRQIVASDRLLLLRNRVAGSRLKLQLGSLLQQYEDTCCFRAGKEHVLVIGPSDDAFVAAIQDVFHGRAKQLILVDPTADENEVTENGWMLQCRMTRDAPRQFDELVGSEETGKYFHAFRQVTRALILCPEGHLEKHGKNPIYQDDRTMALCIAVREIYERKFAKDLHVVAELRCDSNLELFRDVGIVQPVPTEMLIDLILSRMVFHGGLVTEFLLKSMSYRHHNRKVRLEKCAVQSFDEGLRESIVGKTYDEVLEILRDSAWNMHLLAFVRSAGHGDIIVNPINGSDEAQIPLTASDSMFVFRAVDHANEIQEEPALTSVANR